MNNDKSTHSENKRRSMKDLIKNPKKMIVFFVIFIVILCLGIGAYNYFNNHLSDDEKLVAKVVKKYHDSLKNPDSMQIFEIRIYNNEEKKTKMILMDTMAQNGFGGSTRDIVAYTDDIKYLGNDSKADTEITKYTDNSNEIVVSRIIYETWYDNGKYIDLDTNEYISINVDKILRNYEKIK